MSTASRRRRANRKARKAATPSRLAAPFDVLDVLDECDCPYCSDPNCSDAEIDLGRLLDELTADISDLVQCADPLEAELTGAALLSAVKLADDAFGEALVGWAIPQLEARATTEATALLLALGSVAGDRVGKAASAAADRLGQAGVPRPRWADELGEPLRAIDCCQLVDRQGTASMLACTFHRAGRSHAVLMTVDHQDCGAAREILLLEAEQLPAALQAIKVEARAAGFEITTQELDAAQFRGHVESALDARAAHDESVADDQDGEPGYRTLAMLMRTRMYALPAPMMPATRQHGHNVDRNDQRAALETLAQLFGGTSGTARQTPPARLPAKRKKSDGQAPVYQIKIALRGARPPIWRRLELPADISLGRLHDVVQLAFGWGDSHLHVFDTPYGQFGVPDAELGHRSEAKVTLEQVAPTVGSKIGYTYDFGDDWDHDIVVEKVLPWDQTASYPRCTGGRRAAPPEDCGGIWGYAELVEAVADPSRPDHEDGLDWLGLDHPAEFDPDAFDAKVVTRALERLR